MATNTLSAQADDTQSLSPDPFRSISASEASDLLGPHSLEELANKPYPLSMMTIKRITAALGVRMNGSLSTLQNGEILHRLQIAEGDKKFTREDGIRVEKRVDGETGIITVQVGHDGLEPMKFVQHPNSIGVLGSAIGGLIDQMRYRAQALHPRGPAVKMAAAKERSVPIVIEEKQPSAREAALPEYML